MGGRRIPIGSKIRLRRLSLKVKQLAIVLPGQRGPKRERPVVTALRQF